MLFPLISCFTSFLFHQYYHYSFLHHRYLRFTNTLSSFMYLCCIIHCFHSSSSSPLAVAFVFMLFFIFIVHLNIFCLPICLSYPFLGLSCKHSPVYPSVKLPVFFLSIFSILLFLPVFWSTI